MMMILEWRFILLTLIVSISIVLAMFRLDTYFMRRNLKYEWHSKLGGWAAIVAAFGVILLLIKICILIWRIEG